MSSYLNKQNIVIVSRELFSSDGQIRIMTWFKLWLNHLIWLQQDLIWNHVIWFEFIMIWFVIRTDNNSK